MAATLECPGLLVLGCLGLSSPQVGGLCLDLQAACKHGCLCMCRQWCAAHSRSPNTPTSLPLDLEPPLENWAAQAAPDLLSTLVRLFWLAIQSCCTFLTDGGLGLQAENANGLQRQLAGVADNFQIIGSDGQLQNTVQLGPLLSINADATCRPDGSGRTIVDISSLYAKLGPLRSAPRLSRTGPACCSMSCTAMPYSSSSCHCGLATLVSCSATLCL